MTSRTRPVSPRHAPPNALTALRQTPLFASLTEPALLALAGASHVRYMPRGQVLFNQTDPADSVYVVCAGAIAIILATADGRELVINEMRPGDFFGESALLRGQSRSATAVAREPSEVITIPGAYFLAELEGAPALMRLLLETFANRLRNSSERESALAFLTAPARLARLLLQRSQSAVDDSEFLLTVSQDEIAQHVGVTRQTVAKILGGWRRAGWIITGRGRIMLVNRAALKRLARDAAA